MAKVLKCHAINFPPLSNPPHRPPSLSQGNVVHRAAQEERGEDGGRHHGGGASVPAEALSEPRGRAEGQRRAHQA